MAGGAPDTGDGMIEEINIVPLVDIVLVLLIIFMLTANFLDQQAIRINLPAAAAGDGAVPGTFSIVIDESDRLYLNGAPATPEAIAAELAKTGGGAAQATVLIQGDRRASHGRVTEVMGLLKANGVTRFGINLDPGVRPVPSAPPQGEPPP